jgi:hypothetical protein
LAPTLSRSCGKNPEAFLRGCGLSPVEALKPGTTTLLSKEAAAALEKQILPCARRAPQRRRADSHCSRTTFVDELRRLLSARDVYS